METGRNHPKPRRHRTALGAFVASFVAALAVGVPVALAVGWVGIPPTEYNIPAYSGVLTNCCVYSQKMQVWQNQSDISFANMHGIPLPRGTWVYYNNTGVLWNYSYYYFYDSNPSVWYQNGGNKFAGCLNESTTDSAGRRITCQYYSTV